MAPMWGCVKGAGWAVRQPISMNEIFFKIKKYKDFN